MHIVIDAHLAVKEIDGVARYLIGLLSELPGIDRAVRYSILALPPEQSSLPEEIFAKPNVKRVELKLMGPSPRQHLIMRGLLKELQADLYHHPQYDLPLGLEVPAVVTIHDLKYLFHPEYLKKRNRLKQLYIRKSLQHSLKAADHIIAVSQNTLNDLKKINAIKEEKVSVIHHGVRTPPAPLQNDVKKRFNISNDFILFVGTRRPHKNIEGLIRALAILRQSHGLGIDLVVSGKAYSDYSAPERLAKQLGMHSHTHFLDFVSEAQLSALYRTATVVALVSFYEGFGFPILEAMAHGTPVVGSKVSSIPEVMGEAGLLADPHDSEDIAKKIFQIVTDKQLYRKLSAAGLARAKEFSWTSVAKATLNVYIKVLNDS